MFLFQTFHQLPQDLVASNPMTPLASGPAPAPPSQAAVKQNLTARTETYAPQGTTTPQTPGPITMAVTVCVSALQLRFLMLEGQAGCSDKVTELRRFYSVQATEIEEERHSALTPCYQSAWDDLGINSHYDNHHHQLIDRVESSLGQVESQLKLYNSSALAIPTSGTLSACASHTNGTLSLPASAATPVNQHLRSGYTPLSQPATPASGMSLCSTPASGMSLPTTPASGMFPPTTSASGSTQSAVAASGPSPPSLPRPSIIQPLNPVATQIMTNWYERNKEHPYPSYETAEVMATAGNVTVEQVKKWFANRRRRAGNTKSLQAVAQRRLRARKESCDLMVGGAKRTR